METGLARPGRTITGFLLAVLFSSGCMGGKEPAWSPPAAEIYAAMYIGGIVRSLDGGLNWFPMGADARPITAYRKSLALGGEEQIFVGTTGGGLYVLEEKDGPYHHRSRGLHRTNIQALFFNQEDRVLWAGTWGAGVFTSGDGGENWTSNNQGLTAYHVNCLVPDPRDPSRLWCGTTAGLFQTSDDGTWTEVQDLTGQDVRCILIAAGSASGNSSRMWVGQGWVGGGNHLLASEDGGRSWKDDDSGLPQSAVFCLATDDSRECQLAGTIEGVFQRKAGRHRWVRFGAKLPEVRVFSLATLEGYCFAATEHGLFGIPPTGRRWRPLSHSVETTAVTDVVIRPALQASPPGSDL